MSELEAAIDREVVDRLSGLRELSLRQCSRITGVHTSVLAQVWDEIPTARRTPGGHYRVTTGAYEQFIRSGEMARLVGNTNAAGATAASLGR